jgi:drug/metabolite transporter (DMT)-like permease
MRRGVLACLAAGAIWGGIFVGPRVLPQYDALTFSLARYLCFGVLSCVLFGWAHRGRPVHIERRDAITAALLGLIGNLVYFIALVTAIHLTGIAYSSLIVGLLPVTTTLVADWRERRAGHPVIAFRTLLPPLIVIAAGVAAVNADLFLHSPSADSQSPAATLTGIVAAFGALAAWTVYAVLNSTHVRSGRAPDSRDWATLQGIGTLFWIILVLAAWTLAAEVTDAFPQPHVFAALAEPSFLAWCLYLGIGASWVGTALWNHGARALPATLSGQMIVFETIFALLYAFVLEARGPRILEMIAIVCLLGGATWAMRVHAPAPH